jgi:uncharacterized iron-regulated protein
MIRRGAGRAMALAGLLLLTACAGTLLTPIAPGAIWSTGAQQFVSYDEMLRRLTAADIVFLGELHDDAGHHADQLKVLTDILAAGRSPAVAMEQFDRKNQAALDRARRERPLDSHFAGEQADFNFKGWDWSFYAPIVNRAFAAGLPLIASNFSREEASEIVRDGLGAVSSERRTTLAIDRPLPRHALRDLEDAISEGHCGRLPRTVVRGMAQAQRMRDAIMADAVIPYAGRGVVVIAGRGHARRDYGAPFYIAARDPRLDVVSVGLFELDSQGRPGDDEADRFATQKVRPVFDFLWFAPAVERADSCRHFATTGLLTPSQAEARP